MKFSLTLILLYATRLTTGLYVHGSPDLLVTQLGGTVILPCFTQTSLPLEGLEVEWKKIDSESLVIIFQQRESRPELQSEDFRGRVQFFSDEMAKGNYSILLKNVVKNDVGTYRCEVNTTQDSSETIVEMKVIEHLVVTGANKAILASVGDEVILNCSVDSSVPVHEIEEVSWKRTDQDIIIMLYQDKQILSDASHERYQERAEFFADEIPKGNFSLKLRDVKMDDKGEYMCEVHTSHASAHTIVVLQRLGFSIIHLLILFLCLAALLLAMGLGAPVFILLKKKVTRGKLMKMNISLMLCPNICICAAFILWSTEGFLNEVIICSMVSIIRPLMLMKTFPNLNRFPMCLSNAVKDLAIPVYHSFIVIAVCSIFFYNIVHAQTASEHITSVMAGLAAMAFIGAIILARYSLRMHSTVCLEICNVAMLGLNLSESKQDFETSIQISSEVAPIITGILMVHTLQRHYFQGKPFKRLHIALSSLIVISFSLTIIGVYILLSISLKDFARPWPLPLQVVLYITTWVGIILLLHSNRCQGCCPQKKMIGYFCCAVIITCLMAGFGSLCLHYISNHMKDTKDYTGHMALTVLIHVLAATSVFQHPKNIPDLPHIVIYMFGAVGLNIVTSITLATELNLKAGKGVRTIEDLRVIVLPFETIFVSAWLALEIYGFWIGTRQRKKQNSIDHPEADTQVHQEMEDLSPLEANHCPPSISRQNSDRSQSNL